MFLSTNAIKIFSAVSWLYDIVTFLSVWFSLRKQHNLITVDFKVILTLRGFTLTMELLANSSIQKKWHFESVAKIYFNKWGFNLKKYVRNEILYYITRFSNKPKQIMVVPLSFQIEISWIIREILLLDNLAKTWFCKYFQLFYWTL